jgi:hypothetical protein
VWEREVEQPVMETLNNSTIEEEKTVEEYAKKLQQRAEGEIKSCILAMASETVTGMVNEAKKDLLVRAQRDYHFIALTLDSNSDGQTVSLTAVRLRPHTCPAKMSNAPKSSTSISVEKESLDDPHISNNLRLLLTPAGFLGGGGAMAAGAVVIGLAALPAAAAALAVATAGGLLMFLTTSFMGPSMNSAAEGVKKAVGSSLAKMKKKFLETVAQTLREELTGLWAYIDTKAVECIGALELRHQELCRSNEPERNEQAMQAYSAYVTKHKVLMQKVKLAQALFFDDQQQGPSSA